MNTLRISETQAYEIFPQALNTVRERINEVSGMAGGATFLEVGYFLAQEKGQLVLELLTVHDLDTPDDEYHMRFQAAIEG